LCRHKYRLLPLHGFVSLGGYRGGLNRADSVPPDFWSALRGAIRRRLLTVKEARAITDLAEAMLDRKELRFGLGGS
jgi:hypothetical protein